MGLRRNALRHSTDDSASIQPFFQSSNVARIERFPTPKQAIYQSLRCHNGDRAGQNVGDRIYSSTAFIARHAPMMKGPLGDKARPPQVRLPPLLCIRFLSPTHAWRAS